MRAILGRCCAGGRSSNATSHRRARAVRESPSRDYLPYVVPSRPRPAPRSALRGSRSPIATLQACPHRGTRVRTRFRSTRPGRPRHPGRPRRDPSHHHHRHRRAPGPDPRHLRLRLRLPMLTGPLARTGYRTIVVEPLGYGWSSHPKDADYSFAAQTGRVSRALDSLGVTQALVVAQSSGAAIAFRLAVLRPDLVRGLLSIDGGPAETAATPGMKKAFKFGGGRSSSRWTKRSSGTTCAARSSATRATPPGSPTPWFGLHRGTDRRHERLDRRVPPDVEGQGADVARRPAARVRRACAPPRRHGAPSRRGHGGPAGHAAIAAPRTSEPTAFPARASTSRRSSRPWCWRRWLGSTWPRARR